MVRMTGKIGWHLSVRGDVCRDGGGFRGGGDVQERGDVVRKLGEGGVACRHLRYTPELGFRVEGSRSVLFGRVFGRERAWGCGGAHLERQVHKMPHTKRVSSLLTTN